MKLNYYLNVLIIISINCLINISYIHAGNNILSFTVIDGYLQPSGKFVGTYTSQLQANVINTLYPAIEPATVLSQISLVNNSVLRYLHLEGNYYADSPLTIPSLFVLQLNGSYIVDAQNISDNKYNGMTHSGLITLNNSEYSAVIGGTINATVHATTKMQAISVLNSNRNTIRGTRALSNFQTAIGIHGGIQNEIAYCDAGGNEGNRIASRAIWALATSKCYVHHCHVHHSHMHALDFDAYTSSSIAWNNLCEDNDAEGIFVEETAKDNVIVSNTCRRNKNGIGVYSNVVGPVKNNVFFGNLVDGNFNSAITAGGLGHGQPNKHQSDSNTFFSNIASNVPIEKAAFNPMHGANNKDYWFNNEVNGNNVAEFFPIPSDISNVAIFQP